MMMKIKGVTVVVVKEAMVERQLSVHHHQEMEDIVRRLDILRGNTRDVSPDNTPSQNSRIIAQQNQERFQNRQIKERQNEISNIPKGIINKSKSSISFNF